MQMDTATIRKWAMIASSDRRVMNCVSTVLAKERCEVLFASTPRKALALVKHYRPDLVVLDARMNRPNANLESKIRAWNEEISIIELVVDEDSPVAFRTSSPDGTKFVSLNASLSGHAHPTIYQLHEQVANSKRAGTLAPLARVEWEHIRKAMNHCEGNVTRAALQLSMNRRSLQRKLSRYRDERSIDGKGRPAPVA